METAKMASACSSPDISLMTNATRTSSYMVRVDDSDDLKSLCTKYVPFWNTLDNDDIKVNRITIALTNRVYKVQITHPEDGTLRVQKVLLRIISADKTILFDLDHQNEVLELLSSYEFAPKLVAVFPGGRIEQWLDGFVLDTDSLQNLSIVTSIASLLGKFHRIVSMVAKPSWSRRPSIERTIEKWIPHARTIVKDNGLNIEVEEMCRAFDIYKKVIAKHAETSQSFSNKVMFCHNDLHIKNIIATYHGLRLIDFEYSGFNYVGYDIANFFAEITFCYDVDIPPYFRVDESLELSRDLKVLFASVYLSEVTSSNVMPSDSELVEEFLRSIEIHSLGPMLFWSFWGILMVTQPEANVCFDYLAYSKIKFDVFKRILKRVTVEYTLD
ncbi:choline/ethanolamine kinase, putative [Theileria equi strain WA]|uniref:Choline/ethanolamine kinase, putative n=1 Tax=Theileria equi strain WA TaxID=1537102 RepID=L0AZ27_THEEQ|nr:choline/ethanolamine kinase, putative [Theileria equi strain WA]AFZ80815.1 choline/ethanolamine kinase, putative [Theileria equi strain WA]|eukprot:XP_004830481.1 choline/ethanolamine kinase, putative [Theileria equi strain WA]